MTKREIASHALWVLGFVLLLGANIYFGWDSEVESDIERMVGMAGLLIVIAAFFVRPTSKEIHHHTINASSVVIRDSNVSANKLEDN